MRWLPPHAFIEGGLTSKPGGLDPTGISLTVSETKPRVQRSPTHCECYNNFFRLEGLFSFRLIKSFAIQRDPGTSASPIGIRHGLAEAAKATATTVHERAMNRNGIKVKQKQTCGDAELMAMTSGFNPHGECCTPKGARHGMLRDPCVPHLKPTKYLLSSYCLSRRCSSCDDSAWIVGLQCIEYYSYSSSASPEAWGCSGRSSTGSS